MAKSEVFSLIDKLNLDIQKARKIPFSDLVCLSQDELLRTLDTIVSKYDPALEEAVKIIANEENIILEAKQAADKSTADANAQAQGVVNEANTYAQKTKSHADAYANETRRNAEENAHAIIADAQARARQMIEDAKAHADDLISNTTIMARAQTQSQEMLESANEHSNALRRQTHRDLSAVLEQVGSSLEAQINEIRMMRQEISSIQPLTLEDHTNQ